MKTIETSVVCHKCGEIVTLDNITNRPKSELVHTEDGRVYTILYVKCPRCKEVTAVQADTEETQKLLKEFKELCGKVVVKKAHGETVSPKEVKKKDRMIKNLRRKREILRNECTGLKFFKENGEIFTEKLTFY